jgi:hypothetical protein
MADSADQFRPERGDDVEAWIRRWRDMLDGDRWIAVDSMLDDYRLHADTGTPLSGEVSGHG